MYINSLSDRKQCTNAAFPANLFNVNNTLNPSRMMFLLITKVLRNEMVLTIKVYRGGDLQRALRASNLFFMSLFSSISSSITLLFSSVTESEH